MLKVMTENEKGDFEPVICAKFSQQKVTPNSFGCPIVRAIKWRFDCLACQSRRRNVISRLLQMWFGAYLRESPLSIPLSLLQRIKYD